MIASDSQVPMRGWDPTFRKAPRADLIPCHSWIIAIGRLAGWILTGRQSHERHIFHLLTKSTMTYYLDLVVELQVDDYPHIIYSCKWVNIKD